MLANAVVIGLTNPGEASSIKTNQEKQMTQGKSTKVSADQWTTRTRDSSYSELLSYYEGRYYDPVTGTRKHP